MPRPTPESKLLELQKVIAGNPKGVTAKEIRERIEERVPTRTLQYRLKYLADMGRITKSGEGRWTRYFPSQRAKDATQIHSEMESKSKLEIPLSKQSNAIQKHIDQPLRKRRPAGYSREFLGKYQPNATFYLGESERKHLRALGTMEKGNQPAGTYARQLLNRLLIDLSWNSSRLEGNTYSLLDTKRLIEFGEVAKGKDLQETQMILNHKKAIEFLVSSAAEIGFNRYTILNLHAILADNLIPDESATGRLRRIAVAIDGSTFLPLENPQVIEECFDLVLAKAGRIRDEFEQAFFVLVHLPYLQPFDDVNKRVARLAANIPLIRRNLCPLSFVDVPTQTYADAMLGVYELRRTELLHDVFVWAYHRSTQRYAAVRQSLGEPDPFRQRFRSQLQEAVGQVIRENLGRKDAVQRLASWATATIPSSQRSRFREVAENELLGLHAGNFARFGITPGEFQAWQEAWKPSLHSAERETVEGLESKRKARARST